MSPELLEHFKNPRNVGELDKPAITVEVSNPVCGDILRLSALIEDGRIVRTGFKVRGCTASIASGSALTGIISGRDRNALKTVTTSDIETAVGGLSNESKHAAALCVEAVRALVAQFPV
jgi:nitrogen fixation NifU-like protein